MFLWHCHWASTLTLNKALNYLVCKMRTVGFAQEGCLQCWMHICPIFCNLPKESAAEAHMLPHESLLAEINSFMQHSQNGIVQQFLLLYWWSLFFFLVLFMFNTFSKSSQKLLCYIFMQQKSPQAPIQTDTEYWSLNLIHAPMNKWHDSVSTRFLAPYPSLNSRISHPSLSLCVSLYLLFLMLFCSQWQGLYAQYF